MRGVDVEGMGRAAQWSVVGGCTIACVGFVRLEAR